jgi:hypothetical protein
MCHKFWLRSAIVKFDYTPHMVIQMGRKGRNRRNGHLAKAVGLGYNPPRLINQIGAWLSPVRALRSGRRGPRSKSGRPDYDDTMGKNG